MVESCLTKWGLEPTFVLPIKKGFRDFIQALKSTLLPEKSLNFPPEKSNLHGKNIHYMWRLLRAHLHMAKNLSTKSRRSVNE